MHAIGQSEQLANMTCSFYSTLHQLWSCDFNHLLSAHFLSFAAFHKYERDIVLGNASEITFTLAVLSMVPDMCILRKSNVASS